VDSGVVDTLIFANRYFPFFVECVNMQNELQLCKGARLFYIRLDT
jgi:hypothetical protein